MTALQAQAVVRGHLQNNISTKSMNFQTLRLYIQEVETEFNQISADRKELLNNLSAFVKKELEARGKADLIFICTHNSRRSHLSQIWAQVAAHYYGIDGVRSYSGGTEATAMYRSAAQALTKAGLDINILSDTKNPIFSIKFNANEPAIIGFSKTYDNSFNVQSGFAAVMTCSHADKNCPLISSAAQRLSLPYNDPKEYDGTPLEISKYDERCRDIARELLYAFSELVKK